jgi:hypothetical protein
MDDRQQFEGVHAVKENVARISFPVICYFEKATFGVEMIEVGLIPLAGDSLVDQSSLNALEHIKRIGIRRWKHHVRPGNIDGATLRKRGVCLSNDVYAG